MRHLRSRGGAGGALSGAAAAPVVVVVPPRLLRFPESGRCWWKWEEAEEGRGIYLPLQAELPGALASRQPGGLLWGRGRR